MRRILLALMSTVALVVTLFGYRTSTPFPASSGTATVAGSTTGSRTTTPGVPQSATGAPATQPGPTAGATTKTVIGSSVDTRYGPVQIELTVASNKITAVNVLQAPSGNGKDQEINSYALPVLTQETLAAQSANIDSVSGATYTSDGYVGSLQSALAQAGL